MPRGESCMRFRDVFFIGLVLAGATTLRTSLFPASMDARTAKRLSHSEVPPVVARVEQALRDQWAEDGYQPAKRASDLAVLRRLTLALTGSIPSLDEVRRFESRPEPGRLAGWLDGLLRDRR